eukprot:2305774-Rhodomonas_salina.6
MSVPDIAYRHSLVQPYAPSQYQLLTLPGTTVRFQSQPSMYSYHKLVLSFGASVPAQRSTEVAHRKRVGPTLAQYRFSCDTPVQYRAQHIESAYAAPYARSVPDFA